MVHGLPAQACSVPYPRWLWQEVEAVEFFGSGPSWPGSFLTLIGRPAETDDYLKELARIKLECLFSSNLISIYDLTTEGHGQLGCQETKTSRIQISDSARSFSVINSLILS